MPSIFSRSRTASTPYPASPDSPHGADEFGRVSSRQSNHKGTGGGGGLFSGTSKRDKKKAAAKEAQMVRLRTMSGVASPGPSIHSPVDAGDGFGIPEGVFEYAGIFVQDGAFFPTILEKPSFDTSNGAGHALDRSFNSSYSSTLSTSSNSSLFSSGSSSTMDYPYLSYQRHVVLSVDTVARLVDVVCEELGTRGGITTPFIFSTLALDISPTRIRRLIDCFLATCTSTHLYNQRSTKEKSIAEKDHAEQKWREEARFAGMHELGMALRWALARVVRVSGGQESRGLFPYEWYSQWRDEEEALLYPPTHFTALLPSLAGPVRDILLTILSLLARLTANSATSGHTPPTLSPLFGPLLFGLGPPSLPFHHTYVYYLRSVNALEHILLAFVRWQDTPRSASNSPNLLGEGSQTTLGVPKKLKEWIKGYPATLPHLDPHNLKRRQEGMRPEPRKGARVARVMSVKRNVRSYDKDLVKYSASWSKRPGFLHGQPQASQTNVVGGLESSREWDRIAPMTRRGSADRQPPKYSEAYKKRMNIPSSVNPDLGVPGNTSPTATESSFLYGLNAPSLSASTSSGTKDFLGVGNLGLGSSTGEDRFKSLTDLKWGEFEDLGFGGLGTGGVGDKKLEFDLTEGARTARSKKRQTLGWDDFSSAGFSRGDDPLKTTLQFSAPLTATIESWPKEKEEISRKLKKREKALPPFGWDTSPVIGSEEVIEEAFMDVFCDLIWGSGWGEGLAGLSGLRDEGVTTKDGLKVQVEDRECNWAMVEFKSIPTSRSQSSSRPAHYPKPAENDARSADTLILFEEFVPLEYRQQLAVLVAGNRKRLPSLFSPKKNQWKQAATLNGKPYVVGHVPTGGPNYREMEFEGLLQGAASGETRLLSLSTSVKVPKNVPPTTEKPPPLPQQPPHFQALVRQTSASEDHHSDSTLQSATQGTQKRKFKLPTTPTVGSRNKAAGLTPAEYSTVDFDTRLRGYSDDSNSVGGSSLDEYGGPDEDEEKRKKRERRESRRPPEDAWVDILVGTQERRMAGQDAVMRSKDPEAASMEVAQALAAVQNHRFSPSDDEEDMAEKEKEMKRVLHEHRPYGDFDDEDLSEIETVPRRERPRESYTSTVDYTDDSQSVSYSADAPPVEDEEPNEPPKKKLGYFDLHPERRPPSMLEDDPRARAMEKYNDSDDEGEDAAFATPAAPTPALAAAPTTPQGHVRPLPTVPPPASPPETTPSPVSQPVPKPLPSKTASLIEMYREREKGAPAPGAGGAPNAPSTGPSKIPIRTGGKSELPSPPSAPSAPSPPQKEPSPPLLSEPPKIAAEETGRASPGRYIHGAPLHNVLEEEEEED
ncbi:hypothetical protein PM082_018943 [Marasmius tenuissimus]|nr:hypothetical protein PM082_018943 [Marasmius tenuissimus]